jgi:hypothetical protein
LNTIFSVFKRGYRTPTHSLGEKKGLADFLRVFVEPFHLQTASTAVVLARWL